MRPTMGKAVMGGVVVILAATLPGRAQSTSSGSGNGVQMYGQFSRQQQQPSPFADGLTGDPAWNARRLKALNADRQKSMVSDAEKLLKLARQLDAEVASNSRNDLTPSELHKLAEIEKLARSVKSKMALSFTGGPQLRGSAMSADGSDAPRE